MRLLLDMQAFLWFALDEPQLSSTAPCENLGP